MAVTEEILQSESVLGIVEFLYLCIAYVDMWKNTENFICIFTAGIEFFDIVHSYFHSRFDACAFAVGILFDATLYAGAVTGTDGTQVGAEK